MNLIFTGYNIILPNPRTEDIKRYSSNGIRRRTPGGILKVFKDSNWPVIESFIYTVIGLKEAQRDDVISFFNASAGQEITVIDHFGASRTGFCVTPVNEILTTKDGCWYDINFELMATAIVNITGDCPVSGTPDTPAPGDPDYHLPPDDQDIYIIYAEDDNIMTGEDGTSTLYIEAY